MVQKLITFLKSALPLVALVLVVMFLMTKYAGNLARMIGLAPQA